MGFKVPPVKNEKTSIFSPVKNEKNDVFLPV